MREATLLYEVSVPNTVPCNNVAKADYWFNRWRQVSSNKKLYVIRETTLLLATKLAQVRRALRAPYILAALRCNLGPKHNIFRLIRTSRG